MNDCASVKKDLKTLLLSQNLAVLATHDHGQPCTHLMAFAVTQDLTEILMVTNRATRKFQNISSDPRVSIMVDNREKALTDFSQAVTASASGRATETRPGESTGLLQLYLDKHPHLESFILAPTTALLSIRVTKYDLVRRFQNVHELWMDP